MIERREVRVKLLQNIGSRLLIVTAAVVLLGIGVAALMPETEFFLRISKGIELFGKVYREVALNYVDEIDPSAFAEAGITGMLKTLDPYTVYLSGTDEDEIELITSGKFGGIGITVSVRGGLVYVTSVMEGYAAARQGIAVGDRILSVDGVSLDGKSLHDIFKLVRGPAGTEIRLTVDREDVMRPLDFVLVREEIQIRAVTATGLITDGIGYIKLARFTRTAGEEVRLAIKDLKTKDTLRALILDLRENPGGLLDIAVDVAGKFLPDSSLVVTTRGRRPESEIQYRSRGVPPVPADVRLAVLINNGSASAAEIVAGAVQDLDRGVLIGERSYGKGLVQTVTRLGEQSSLKMTTGRYYTPSGRCIQEIEYTHTDADGGVVVVPDSSRREFRTSRNRPVYASGGIDPDSVVTDDASPVIVQELRRQGMFYRFARLATERFTDTSGSFIVRDTLLVLFEKFLNEQKFSYEDPAETALKEFRRLAEENASINGVSREISHLEKALVDAKREAFKRHKTLIREELRLELIGKVRGEEARILASLERDKQARVALGILRNNSAYNFILLPRWR